MPLVGQPQLAAHCQQIRNVLVDFGEGSWTVVSGPGDQELFSLMDEVCSFSVFTPTTTHTRTRRWKRSAPLLPWHGRLPIASTGVSSCSAAPSDLPALSTPGTSSAEPTGALAERPLLIAVNKVLVLVFVFHGLLGKTIFGLPLVVLHSTC